MSFGLQIAIIVLLCVIMIKGMDLNDNKKENKNYPPLFSLKGGVTGSSDYYNQLFARSIETTPNEITDVDHITLAETKRQYIKKSNYHGISLNKDTGKWIIADLYTKEQKEMLKYKYNIVKFSGFYSAKDAAMKLNDICDKMGIDHKNPGIGINTIEKEFKTKSKYKNVYKHCPEPRWRAVMTVKGKTYRLGRFKDENDAGMAVNEKCAELEIDLKNPAHLFDKNMTHEKNVEHNKKKSRFLCVTLDRPEKIRWKATIHKPKVELGYFDTEIEAARALNEIYLKYNIPQDPEFLRHENVTMNTDEDETDGSSTKRKRKD